MDTNESTTEGRTGHNWLTRELEDPRNIVTETEDIETRMEPVECDDNYIYAGFAPPDRAARRALANARLYDTSDHAWEAIWWRHEIEAAAWLATTKARVGHAMQRDLLDSEAFVDEYRQRYANMVIDWLAGDKPEPPVTKAGAVSTTVPLPPPPTPDPPAPLAERVTASHVYGLFGFPHSEDACNKAIANAKYLRRGCWTKIWWDNRIEAAAAEKVGAFLLLAKLPGHRERYLEAYHDCFREANKGVDTKVSVSYYRKSEMKPERIVNKYGHQIRRRNLIERTFNANTNPPTD